MNHICNGRTPDQRAQHFRFLCKFSLKNTIRYIVEISWSKWNQRHCTTHHLIGFLHLRQAFGSNAFLIAVRWKNVSIFGWSFGVVVTSSPAFWCSVWLSSCEALLVVALDVCGSQMFPLACFLSSSCMLFCVSNFFNESTNSWSSMSTSIASDCLFMTLKKSLGKKTGKNIWQVLIKDSKPVTSWSIKFLSK